MARRINSGAALVVIVAFVGVGLALVVAASLLGLGVSVVDYGAGDLRASALQAPGVLGALGAELIAAAVLVGWRAGAGITADAMTTDAITTEQEDGREPVVG